LHLACLHDRNKSGFFGGPVFFLANQSNLKSFQKAPIGWKKAGPPKKPLLFDHVNRLIVQLVHDHFCVFCVKMEN